MGAGNNADDRAHTHEVAPPLRDRAGEVELNMPSIEIWTEWASKQGIESRIIGYLNFKSSSLHKVDFEDNQKFTTGRGWERVSTLIQGIDNLNQLDLYTSSAIGEGVAKEFVAFCKIKNTIDMEKLFKNPEEIRNIGDDIGIKFFVATAVADRYKDKKIDFAKLQDMSREFDKLVGGPEIVAYMWKLSSGMSKRFKKDFIAGVDEDLEQKYAKWILD